MQFDKIKPLDDHSTEPMSGEIQKIYDGNMRIYIDSVPTMKEIIKSLLMTGAIVLAIIYILL